MSERDWLDEVWDRVVAILYGVVGALLAAALLLMLPSGCGSAWDAVGHEMTTDYTIETCELHPATGTKAFLYGGEWVWGRQVYVDPIDRCDIWYCSDNSANVVAYTLCHETDHCLCDRAGRDYGDDSLCMSESEARCLPLLRGAI